MEADVILVVGITLGLILGVGIGLSFYKKSRRTNIAVDRANEFQTILETKEKVDSQNELKTPEDSNLQIAPDLKTEGEFKGEADLQKKADFQKTEDLSRDTHRGQKARSVETALTQTRAGFFGRIRGLFQSRSQLESSEMELLEEILYTSDLGPQTVQRLMGAVEGRLSEAGGKANIENVRLALRDEMVTILERPGQAHLEELLKSASEKTPESSSGTNPSAAQQSSSGRPLKVWMIVGVNGAGKTTTIGKLAHRMATLGHKVLIAAGDTFRAAAGEQLKIWSERAQVDIFSPAGVTSPSAVAFDACKKAGSGDYTLLIVDTAGRLHTQKHLMEELIKMKRVIEKAIPGSPHEVLLVLDANAGQNALIQAREFHQALKLSGAVLTKMDGTAKGGVAVGVACEIGIPIRLIGIGEGIDDLRTFNSSEFVDAII